MQTKKTDVIIIKEYLEGNEAALETLIARYLKPVYGFAYRYAQNASDAEDITQEVFVRVWKNIKKFDENRNFKTWIFSIAKHAALDLLKKKRAFSFSQFETHDGENPLLETLADPLPLQDELSVQKSITEVVERAIQQLSPRYRAVVISHFRDQFTFREIAESLNESLNTTKSRYRRALAILKKSMQKPY